MRDEETFHDIAVLKPMPGPDASHEDKVNWMISTACQLGQVVSNMARSVGANDKQLALIFAYMHGRTIGAYLAKDELGQAAAQMMFEMGANHAKENLNDFMQTRASAEGTETKQ